MNWFHQEQQGVINALLQASRSSAFLTCVLLSRASCGAAFTVTLTAGFSKWAPKTAALHGFAGVN